MELTLSPKAEIANLEAERQSLIEKITLVENEPMLADRVGRLHSQVSCLIGYVRETPNGSVQENGQLQSIQREVDVLECQLREMKGFAKKAAAHRELLRFSPARLLAAKDGGTIGTFTVFVKFHDTITALGYWIDNAERKIAMVEGMIAKYKKQQRDIEAKAAPLKAELDDLYAKLDRLRASQAPKEGWGRGIVAAVMDPLTQDEGDREEQEEQKPRGPGSRGRSTARVST